MNKYLWKPALGLILVGGLILALAAACTSGVSQQDYDAVQGQLKAAQTQVAQLSVVAPHPALAAHPYKPKRLEAVIEIDMLEFSFDNPQGEKNPTFRLPAGKTVGIHIHNEGAIMHELMIGRTGMEGMGVGHGEEHGYEEMLTEMVPMDLFAYYGKEKAEVEGASFEELEVGPGIRDFWLRFTVPVELKGEWEIGCFIKEADGKDHYEEGMHAKLIFE